MKFWTWRKVFKALILGMFFSKSHQYATIDVKVYMNFKYVLLCLHKHICKNALVGFKTMAKVDENGIKLVHCGLFFFYCDYLCIESIS